MQISPCREDREGEGRLGQLFRTRCSFSTHYSTDPSEMRELRPQPLPSLPCVALAAEKGLLTRLRPAAEIA